MPPSIASTLLYSPNLATPTKTTGLHKRGSRPEAGSSAAAFPGLGKASPVRASPTASKRGLKAGGSPAPSSGKSAIRKATRAEHRKLRELSGDLVSSEEDVEFTDMPDAHAAAVRFTPAASAVEAEEEADGKDL